MSRSYVKSFFIISASTLLMAAVSAHAEDKAPHFAPLPFDLKPDETLSSSKNWISLNEAAGIQAAKENKQIVLMMANNARFRSSDVAAYPEILTLTATWQITNDKGAMGFGWIDFSTSQYYYLYEDISRNEMILQRGDGVSTKQLALYPLPTANGPRNFSIVRKSLSAAQTEITVLVDGTVIGEAITDRPEQEMGSTFQIYVGSGNDAEVTLSRISTIPATSRTRGGSGWFW